MSKLLKNLLLACLVATGSATAAFADGDGGDSGDNSMSQWTGESYAAFHRGEIGDFYTDPKELAVIEDAQPQEQTLVAGAMPMTAHPGNPFRDDTAA